MSIGSSNTQTSAIAERELPFREVARNLPTPCWISDAEGLIIWVNAAWLAYTGMDAEMIQKQGLEALHDPAILPEVRRRWAIAKARKKTDEMVFPLRGRDGILRPFLTRVAPLRNEAGEITRWFGTNLDISVQAETERLLHDSQARLELAAEAAELGVWDWDLETNAFVYSPRARAICGFPMDGEITYEDVVRVTHPDDYPWTSAQAERATNPADRNTAPYQYRIVRPDGELRWVLAHGRAVFEGEGAHARALRYVGTLQDITERKMADERQMLLMREVDHRAKNALAVVHSLVQLTPESDPKTFKTAIQGRIAALARTHALLADERWEGADLLALTRDELAPFAALPDCDVAIDGLSFRLRPADAQAMALVIHELATNAAKHGALARAGGRLAIAWRYAEGAGLAFTWRETNAGGGAANPSASGFGFTLLDQLIARQMGGAWTREWTGEGFACAITLPGRPAAQAADAG